MSDVIVFPEQFSFDVRVQGSTPRRRLTIKNLGVTAAKLSISPPVSDAFSVTDMKRKTITGNLKRSTIGIVPEDVLVVAGGKTPYKVALKPAVSLVSLEELESVTDKPIEEVDPIALTKSDFDVGSRRADQLPALKSAHKIASELPEDPPPREPHRQSKLPVSSAPDSTKTLIPKKTKKISKVVPEDIPSSRDSLRDGSDPESGREEVPIAPPSKLESAPRKANGIPGRHRNKSGIAPEADVLERSLHVRFSFQEDFAKARRGMRSLNWYDREAFARVQEPDFTFELMMTGENEDPVFCVDGDYYDSSGRLLSVQQGKGKVIYVTEDGFDPIADMDED
jgi:hypothetical protein